MYTTFEALAAAVPGRDGIDTDRQLTRFELGAVAPWLMKLRRGTQSSCSLPAMKFCGLLKLFLLLSTLLFHGTSGFDYELQTHSSLNNTSESDIRMASEQT